MSPDVAFEMSVFPRLACGEGGNTRVGGSAKLRIYIWGVICGSFVGWRQDTRVDTLRSRRGLGVFIDGGDSVGGVRFVCIRSLILGMCA